MQASDRLIERETETETKTKRGRDTHRHTESACMHRVNSLESCGIVCGPKGKLKRIYVYALYSVRMDAIVDGSLHFPASIMSLACAPCRKSAAHGKRE